MKKALEILSNLPALASRNRKTFLFLAAAGLFFVGSFIILQTAESRLEKKKASAALFEAIRAEYLKGIEETGGLKEKLAASNSASALDAVQAAAAEAGLKKNISRLKPFEAAQVAGFRQSGAEVLIEGINIGQAITFLHTIENGPSALVADELRMKSSFENPDALELRARIRLITKEQP